MGPVPFIALELLERGPPMLDDYRVPAHRLPDQLPAGTEAVAQLAELALLAIRLFFAFTSRGEMRRCSFSVRLLIQIQMLNDSTVTLSIIEYEFSQLTDSAPTRVPVPGRKFNVSIHSKRNLCE